MNPVESAVAERLRAGRAPTAREVHAGLVREPLQERIAAAHALALEAIRNDDRERAGQLLEVYWLIGGRDLGLLDVLVRQLRAGRRLRDAIDRVREAAHDCVVRRDVPGLARCVELSVDLRAAAGLPPYDPLLVEWYRAALAPHALPARPLPPTGPLRIGYVFWGDAHPYSTLPGVFLRLAQHHDRSRFEPLFFSELCERRLVAPAARALLEHARQSGIPVVFNPGDAVDGTPMLERAVGLVGAIAAAQVDLVVFQSQYPVFMTAALLRPAPVVLGWDHGSPTYYTSAALDASVTSHDRFVIEHPCDARLIDRRDCCFLPGPEPEAVPLQRAPLGIPADARVVLTAGFPAKFEPQVAGIGDYARMIAGVLARHPDAWWVVAGVTAQDMQHLQDRFDAGTRARVRYLGVTRGLAGVLPLADIYLDTFPISGGLSTYQAMRAGLPTITYRFWFNGLFDKQKEYSLVGDVLGDGELVVAQPDLAHLEERLERLLADAGFRSHLGQLGARAMAGHSDMPRYARVCEDLYESVVAARRATARSS